ncbi:hypothetical protein [Bradyrhizobium sp. S3.5.5]|uniref:hypothetical protein n=1 Tax=Bradyrhizobium sp. S3.5.5 TaxID=3156430 RepID=UPI00339B78A6
MESLGLDRNLDFMLAGLERWKASDRWEARLRAEPLAFLNQERWKDIPPAAIASSKTGEGEVDVAGSIFGSQGSSNAFRIPRAIEAAGEPSQVRSGNLGAD